MVLNHILNHMRPKKLSLSQKKSNVSLFYSLIRYIYIWKRLSYVGQRNSVLTDLYNFQIYLDVWLEFFKHNFLIISPFLASESIQLSLLFLLNCKRCSCRHFFFVLSFFFFHTSLFFSSRFTFFSQTMLRLETKHWSTWILCCGLHVSMK